MNSKDIRRISYTAASALPLKLLHSEEALAGIRLGRIFPIHLQFTPTDRCQLRCSWCSCANDSRKTSISMERVGTMVEILSRWATKAITITGGGEPLMHPDIEEMIELFESAGWKIGLVTNAFLFDRIGATTLRRLKWCRISCSDDRGLETRELGNIIARAVDAAPLVDWAFSYVVTAKFNPSRLADYIWFANNCNFTHVRVVSDLLDLDNVPDMDDVKKSLIARDVDDKLVIYQGRKDSTRGCKDCWISLLKPVISAAGEVFPCCGAQYALETPTLNMPPELCMGTIEDLDSILARQVPFDGSICRRCYYEQYNIILGAMLGKIEHGEFV